MRRSVRRTINNNPRSQARRLGDVVLFRDFSHESLRSNDTFTRASGQLWLDSDNNLRTAGINEEVYEGKWFLSAGVYSSYDLSGNLIPNLKGITTGPAVTNKCRTFGFVPDDEEQAPLTSGVMIGGRVYKIKAQSSTTSFVADGAPNPHAVGDTFVAADVPSVTLSASDSVAEISGAVGTKSFHNGSVFIQNIGGMKITGDVAGELSIVDATASLDLHGLGGEERNGKAYAFRHNGAVATNFVQVFGDAGALALHTLEVFSDVLSGTPSVRFSVTGSGNALLAVDWDRASSVSMVTDIAQNLQMDGTIGADFNFLLPGVYKQSYAPRQPVPAKSLIAPTTRSANLSTLPVNMPQSFEITIEITPDADGVDISASAGLWSSNDDRGQLNRVYALMSSYTFIVRAEGGIIFFIDPSDIVKGVSAVFKFSAKQNGSNVDVVISLNGVEKLNSSFAGTMDHSNLNAVSPGQANGNHFPTQVKIIEAKAI